MTSTDSIPVMSSKEFLFEVRKALGNSWKFSRFLQYLELVANGEVTPTVYGSKMFEVLYPHFALIEAHNARVPVSFRIPTVSRASYVNALDFCRKLQAHNEDTFDAFIKLLSDPELSDPSSIAYHGALSNLSEKMRILLADSPLFLRSEAFLFLDIFPLANQPNRNDLNGDDGGDSSTDVTVTCQTSNINNSNGHILSGNTNYLLNAATEVRTQANSEAASKQTVSLEIVSSKRARAQQQRMMQEDLNLTKTLEQLGNSIGRDPKYGSDFSFFDQLRIACCHDGIFVEIVKLLLLFSEGLLSVAELFALLDDIFPVENTRLVETCKRLVLARENARRSRSFFCLPLASINFSVCEQAGVSYRRLPPAYPIHTATGRSQLCSSVLNDVWVSIPHGSEDFSFKLMRKNAYEEALFRFEDDRYETDLLIETTKSAISELTRILQRISLLPTTQRQFYRLQPGDIHPVHAHAVRKVYGDSGAELLELLLRLPSASLPVVIERMTKRVAEWTEAQKVLDDGSWAALLERNYARSFDHRSFYFAHTDKRSITARSVLQAFRMHAMKRRSLYFRQAMKKKIVESTGLMPSSQKGILSQEGDSTTTSSSNVNKLNPSASLAAAAAFLESSKRSVSSSSSDNNNHEVSLDSLRTSLEAVDVCYIGLPTIADLFSNKSLEVSDSSAQQVNNALAANNSRGRAAAAAAAAAETTSGGGLTSGCMRSLILPDGTILDMSNAASSGSSQQQHEDLVLLGSATPRSPILSSKKAHNANTGNLQLGSSESLIKGEQASSGSRKSSSSPSSHNSSKAGNSAVTPPIPSADFELNLTENSVLEDAIGLLRIGTTRLSTGGNPILLSIIEALIVHVFRDFLLYDRAKAPAATVSSKAESSTSAAKIARLSCEEIESLASHPPPFVDEASVVPGGETGGISSTVGARARMQKQNVLSSAPATVSSSGLVGIHHHHGGSGASSVVPAMVFLGVGESDSAISVVDVISTLGQTEKRLLSLDASAHATSSMKHESDYPTQQHQPNSSTSGSDFMTHAAYTKVVLPAFSSDANAKSGLIDPLWHSTNGGRSRFLALSGIGFTVLRLIILLGERLNKARVMLMNCSQAVIEASDSLSGLSPDQIHSIKVSFANGTVVNVAGHTASPLSSASATLVHAANLLCQVDPDSRTMVTASYPTLILNCAKMLRGETTQQLFESTLRVSMENEAYVLFTLDRVVAQMSKLLVALAHDVATKQIVSSYLSFRNIPSILNESIQSIPEDERTQEDHDGASFSFYYDKSISASVAPFSHFSVKLGQDKTLGVRLVLPTDLKISEFELLKKEFAICCERIINPNAYGGSSVSAGDHAVASNFADSILKTVRKSAGLSTTLTEPKWLMDKSALNKQCGNPPKSSSSLLAAAAADAVKSEFPESSSDHAVTYDEAELHTSNGNEEDIDMDGEVRNSSTEDNDTESKKLYRGAVKLNEPLASPSKSFSSLENQQQQQQQPMHNSSDLNKTQNILTIPELASTIEDKYQQSKRSKLLQSAWPLTSRSSSSFKSPRSLSRQSLVQIPRLIFLTSLVNLNFKHPNIPSTFSLLNNSGSNNAKDANKPTTAESTTASNINNNNTNDNRVNVNISKSNLTNDNNPSSTGDATCSFDSQGGLSTTASTSAPTNCRVIFSGSASTTSHFLPTNLSLSPSHTLNALREAALATNAAVAPLQTLMGHRTLAPLVVPVSGFNNALGVEDLNASLQVGSGLSSMPRFNRVPLIKFGVFLSERSKQMKSKSIESLTHRNSSVKYFPVAPTVLHGGSFGHIHYLSTRAPFLLRRLLMLFNPLLASGKIRNVSDEDLVPILDVMGIQASLPLYQIAEQDDDDFLGGLSDEDKVEENSIAVQSSQDNNLSENGDLTDRKTVSEEKVASRDLKIIRKCHQTIKHIFNTHNPAQVFNKSGITYPKDQEFITSIRTRHAQTYLGDMDSSHVVARSTNFVASANEMEWTITPEGRLVAAVPQRVPSVDSESFSYITDSFVRVRHTKVSTNQDDDGGCAAALHTFEAAKSTQWRNILTCLQRRAESLADVPHTDRVSSEWQSYAKAKRHVGISVGDPTYTAAVLQASKRRKTQRMKLLHCLVIGAGETALGLPQAGDDIHSRIHFYTQGNRSVSTSVQPFLDLNNVEDDAVLVPLNRDVDEEEENGNGELKEMVGEEGEDEMNVADEMVDEGRHEQVTHDRVIESGVATPREETFVEDENGRGDVVMY